MSRSTSLFRFTQFELPWRLGPPDGRYLLRADGDGDGPPTHVVVFTTLGAPQRRLLRGRRRTRVAEPEPEAEPVLTGRATVIEVGDPIAGPDVARSWLAGVGEHELSAGLSVLNRSLHAFRLASASTSVRPVTRGQEIAARIGYGAGEQVADGLWMEARLLAAPSGDRGRRAGRALIEPQAALAAMLGARRPALVCEELVLRARADVDHRRMREAALQLMVALDAALAELPADPVAAQLGERLGELRRQREAVGAAAQAALSGPLGAAELETVDSVLGRLEAALRARALAII